MKINRRLFADNNTKWSLAMLKYLFVLAKVLAESLTCNLISVKDRRTSKILNFVIQFGFRNKIVGISTVKVLTNHHKNIPLFNVSRRKIF